MYTASRFTTLAGVGVAVGVLCAPALHAQVGDISDVTYPGWIPSDRVQPTVTATVTFDEATGQWQYAWTVANGPDADQDIIKFWLGFQAPPSAADVVLAAPDGWWTGLFAGGGIPGAAFAAERDDEVGDVWPPAAAQIPPGASVTGFAMTSAFPPGEARTYVQGYAPIPFLPDGFDDETGVPHDTTNSQRGWSAGPTRYGEVLSFGRGQRSDVNEFIGFLNLDDGIVRRDPAPIAIKFGPTVDPTTFHAELNRVDVTAAFHPGTAGGADLVGYFAVGASPLVFGRNVLLVTADGLVPGTTRTQTDRDRITFTVEP